MTYSHMAACLPVISVQRYKGTCVNVYQRQACQEQLPAAEEILRDRILLKCNVWKGNWCSNSSYIVQTFIAEPHLSSPERRPWAPQGAATLAATDDLLNVHKQRTKQLQGRRRPATGALAEATAPPAHRRQSRRDVQARGHRRDQPHLPSPGGTPMWAIWGHLEPKDSAGLERGADTWENGLVLSNDCSMKLRNVTSGKACAINCDMAWWFEEHRPRSQATFIHILSHPYWPYDPRLHCSEPPPPPLWNGNGITSTHLMICGDQTFGSLFYTLKKYWGCQRAFVYVVHLSIFNHIGS